MKSLLEGYLIILIFLMYSSLSPFFVLPPLPAVLMVDEGKSTALMSLGMEFSFRMALRMAEAWWLWREESFSWSTFPILSVAFMTAEKRGKYGYCSNV